jgi:predicted permease
VSDSLRVLGQTMRSLLRDRSFSTLCILMLGVGIAANATSFSVLDAVLLRPLPFAQPDRLVQVLERTPEGQDFSTSQPNYLDLRTQTRTLEELAAYRTLAIDLTGRGEPQRVAGAAVSASFFSVLGVAPQLGRTFGEEEDVPGGPRLVVLSDAFWRQLGAPRTILEKTIVLNGAPYAVIGVMPARFVFPDASLWLPLAARADADRGDHWLDMVGRLRPGSTAQLAERELAGIMTRIGELHAGVRGWSARTGSLQAELVGEPMRTGVWVLVVAVALFLLLTCANVANLFVARAHARTQELAVRAALGASRSRLVGHTFLEAALLGGAGAVLALLLTIWSLKALRTVSVDRIPGIESIRFDVRLLFFTLLVTLAATLLFGVLPALRASRANVYELLRSSARTGAARSTRQGRELLVAVQVALATVLLLGSGLLVRSFLALNRVDPGFHADSLVAMPIELTGSQYQSENWRQSVFFQQLAARLQQLPGVSAAGASTTDPFRPMRFVNDVTPVERAADGCAARAWAVVR